MTLAFDTNILVELDTGNKILLNTLKELRKVHPLNPTLPFPVFSEYYFGYLRLGKKEYALKRLEEFEILHSSENSARLFAEIKYDIEKRGKPLPSFDILIAAIAIDHSMTLLTFDQQFKEIKQLNKIILENKKY